MSSIKNIIIICWSLHKQKVCNNFLHGKKTIHAFYTYKLITKLRKKIDVHIFSKSIFYYSLMPICYEYLNTFWSAILWNISQTLTLSFKKKKKKHGHLSMFRNKIFKKCLLFSDIPFAIDVNAVRAAYANHKIETENKLYDLALLMKAYCVSVSIDQNK